MRPGTATAPSSAAIAAIASGQHPIDLMCSLEVRNRGRGRGILGTRRAELDQPIIHAAVVPAA